MMPSKSRVKITFFSPRLSTGLAFLAAALFFLNPASAQIYKWVDEEGKVHYGSEPPLERPVDAPIEEMNVNMGPTGTVTGQQALQNERDAEEARREKIKQEGIPEQPPVPALSGAEIKERCSYARKTLQTIMSKGGQLRQRNKDGEIVYLPEEDRQARIKKAQDAVKEYCY